MENTIVINRNQQLFGIICIMASAIGFGTTGTFSVIMGQAGLNVWDRLAIRYAGAALLLVPLLLYLKRPLKVPRPLLLKIIINAIISFGFTGVLLFLSYQWTTTAMATTIHFTYPLIVILLCVITSSEKITAPILILAMLSLVGLAIMTEPWKNHSVDLVGPLLALASAATFAWYVMFLNNPEIKKIDSFGLIFLLFLISGIFMSIIAVGYRVVEQEHVPIMWNKALPAALGMIVFSTLAPVLLFNIGNRRIGGTTSSILSTLEPLTAILLGMLILGERIHWTFTIGAPMILVSALAISNVRLKMDIN